MNAGPDVTAAKMSSMMFDALPSFAPTTTS